MKNVNVCMVGVYIGLYIRVCMGPWVEHECVLNVHTTHTHTHTPHTHTHTHTVRLARTRAPHTPYPQVV